MEELKDTIALMTSADYKDRFKAEYWQTKIRYEKLHRTLVKYDAGTLTFKPVEDISMLHMSLLRDQADMMKGYLYLLEERAEIEAIDLSE